MIKNTFVGAAESVIIDQDTNLLSLINIYDQITGISFPLIIPKLSIVWSFEKGPDDPDILEAEVLFKLNGHEHVKLPLGINFQGKNKTRCIASFNGWLFKEPGQLEINLVSEEIITQSYLIDLSLIDPEQQQLQL